MRHHKYINGLIAAMLVAPSGMSSMAIILGASGLLAASTISSKKVEAASGTGLTNVHWTDSSKTTISYTKNDASVYDVALMRTDGSIVQQQTFPGSTGSTGTLYVGSGLSSSSSFYLQADTSSGSRLYYILLSEIGAGGTSISNHTVTMYYKDADTGSTISSQRTATLPSGSSFSVNNYQSYVSGYTYSYASSYPTNIYSNTTITYYYKKNAVGTSTQGATDGNYDGYNGYSSSYTRYSKSYLNGTASSAYKSAYDTAYKAGKARKNNEDTSAGRAAGTADGSAGKSRASNYGKSTAYTNAYNSAYTTAKAAYDKKQSDIASGKSAGTAAGKAAGLAGKTASNTPPSGHSSDYNSAYKSAYTTAYNTAKTSYNSDYTAGQNAAKTDVLNSTITSLTGKSAGFTAGYNAEYNTDKKSYDSGVTVGTSDGNKGITVDVSGKDAYYQAGYKSANATALAAYKEAQDKNQGSIDGKNDADKGAKADISTKSTAYQNAYNKAYDAEFALRKTITVNYVDEKSGTTISSDKISGITGSTGTFTYNIPANYVYYDAKLPSNDYSSNAVSLQYAMPANNATININVSKQGIISGGDMSAKAMIGDTKTGAITKSSNVEFVSDGSASTSLYATLNDNDAISNIHLGNINQQKFSDKTSLDADDSTIGSENVNPVDLITGQQTLLTKTSESGIYKVKIDDKNSFMNLKSASIKAGNHTASITYTIANTPK